MLTFAPAADPGEGDDVEEPEGAEPGAAAAEAAAAAKKGAGNAGLPPRRNKPGLAVSLNVDSSSDPDKLEKQLKLLREYGVI